MDKDLKIGNLFYYGDRLAEVSTIHRTHFYCEEYKTRIAFGNSIQLSFKPIPLTEEWILKFGFEVNTYGYVIGKDNLNIHIWMHDDGLVRDIELSSTMISGAYPKIENFKYVHQIQNLYYSLFGEELTIKED